MILCTLTINTNIPKLTTFLHSVVKICLFYDFHFKPRPLINMHGIVTKINSAQLDTKAQLLTKYDIYPMYGFWVFALTKKCHTHTHTHTHIHTYTRTPTWPDRILNALQVRIGTKNKWKILQTRKSSFRPEYRQKHSPIAISGHLKGLQGHKFSYPLRAMVALRLIINFAPLQNFRLRTPLSPPTHTLLDLKTNLG